MCHGARDRVVSMRLARLSAKVLEREQRARTGVSSVTFVGFDGCDHVGAARAALDPVRDWTE